MFLALKNSDIIFFITILVIIAICVGIYFIIPVLNKKKYKQAREELETREKAYHENRSK